MTEPSSEELAKALEAAGAPADMVRRARADHYHDFKSPLAFPEVALMQEAKTLGLTSIVEGVKAGTWDATKEESDRWAASPEGKSVFDELLSGSRARSGSNRAQRRQAQRRRNRKLN